MRTHNALYNKEGFRKKAEDGLLLAFLLLCALAVIAPVILTAAFSLRDGGQAYVDFYIWKPALLAGWVNSFLIATSAACGTILLAVPAAYVFAKVKFRGRGVLFYLYIIVMMMPFQVTLLPQYIVSKGAHLYDTLFALILPGIFAPFAVFLLTQTTKSVPDEILEAARLDTNSTLRVIAHIVVPMIRPGLICAWVLTFAEQWNAVAEPLVLLETREKFPLAVLLNEVDGGEALGFAAIVVFLLLPFLLFAFFKREIAEGLGEYRLK